MGKIDNMFLMRYKKHAIRFIKMIAEIILLGQRQIAKWKFYYLLSVYIRKLLP